MITLQNVWDCASPSERELPLGAEVVGITEQVTAYEFDDRALLLYGGYYNDGDAHTLSTLMAAAQERGRADAIVRIACPGLHEGSYLVGSQSTTISEDESGKHGADMLVLSSEVPR